MKRVRLSKVRVTDYRQPGAGRKSPLERESATRGGIVPGMFFGSSPEDDANHDKMVALFDVVTLRRMESDLGARRLKFAGSPENKWAAARLAAIRRRLNLENLR
jgi:hypothetical protein